MKDMISINDLSRKKVEEILNLAKEIEDNPEKFADRLKGKSLAIAFFEPSTRTKIGFSLAMQKLGGIITEINENKYKNDMSAPESQEDTLRIVGDYSDILAVRTDSEDLIKSLNTKAKIINCGNGSDEHPTQTLIDLYTIWKHFGRLGNISIAIVGNLKKMRAAHSLVLGLNKFDIKPTLISPKSLEMPSKYGVFTSKEDFQTEEDVIYMAGFPPEQGIDNMKYQLNQEKLKSLKENSIIMCPLPRIDEITKDVDDSPKAKYFQQSADGLFVRMATLIKLLE